MLVEKMIDELPSRVQFAQCMERAASVKRDGVDEVRKELFRYYEQFNAILDQLSETGDDDFRWEPEHLYKALTLLREKIGGLQGAAIALGRRVRYFAFEDMSNSQKQVGEKFRAYTDKEKELHARAASADLEGLEKTIEGLFSTLGDRLYTLRSSVKGAWF